MKQSKKILFINGAILFFILFSLNGPAFHQLEKTDTILISEEEEVGRWRISVDITNLDDSQYRGSLKIYVVEPISRWNDYNDEPYHFGFLDFAFEGEIEVSDTLTKNIFWNPTWKSTWDVDKDNLMVIAVLFNEHSEIRYSIPDTQQNEFNAYFSDATAAATPDTIGYNMITDQFTHTVFVEKGTVTWCPACP
ncbi:MAG: hypothetical protein QCI00_07105, partial [Candidatus Thermoplasmatota archaeon]|nr:hypothetical protein [Candidatus Thermoplasmatota archaeon]